MPLTDPRKLIAAGVLLGLMLWAASAHAQLGGTPCTPTTPCAVTALTPDDYFYYIEQSLITGGGAGLFQGQAPFLNAVIGTLGSGIPDAATYAAYFAGWVDFGPAGALLAATITSKIRQTDLNTLIAYQSLAGDFGAEDGALNQIETCNQVAGQTQSVLYALQCTNEAILNLSQHLQLLEAAQLVRGINEVVHHGYELNADAQSGANMQTFLTQAAQHQ
jgi:hypothetical protein